MDHVSDEFLAYLEIKQDLLFHKIPKNKVMAYIDAALTKGREIAADYQSIDIESLYRQHHIDIKIEEHDGKFFDVKLRAQFETDAKGTNLVYLYKASIEELAHGNNLPYSTMLEIILTHEFFHFLESKQPQSIAESLEPIETLHLLGFSRKAHIQRLSEVAANAFTKQALDLSHLPNYYDYRYLLTSDQLSDNDLQEEYLQFSELTS